MRKPSLFFIILFIFIAGALCAEEEFYIVNDGPVAVGGGLVRHYYDTEKGRVAVRYSFEGTSDEGILLSKKTKLFGDDRVTEELITIPAGGHKGRQKASLDVGSHTIKIKMTSRGRLRVSESR